MKIGIRKPNIKSRIKARTTGKIKRKVKKTLNPLYGKKGMGIIKNPKKAIYNKVYNKTTVGVPFPATTSKCSKSTYKNQPVKEQKSSTEKSLFVWAIVLFSIGVIGLFSVAKNAVAYVMVCVLLIITGIGLFLLFLRHRIKAKIQKPYEQQKEDFQIENDQPENNDTNIVSACPHCGVNSIGNICEHCGMSKQNS